MSAQTMTIRKEPGAGTVGVADSLALTMVNVETLALLRAASSIAGGACRFGL